MKPFLRTLRWTARTLRGRAFGTALSTLKQLNNLPVNLAFFHNLPSGGALRAFYDKVRLFSRSGWQVRVYAPETAEHGFLPVPEGVVAVHGSEEMLAQIINASDAKLVYVDKCRTFGAPRILRMLKKPAFYFAHEPLGLAEYQPLAEERPSMAEAAAKFARLTLSDKVLKLFSLPHRMWIKSEDRRSVRAATRVLAPSRFVAAWLRRVYGVEAEVLYQGIDAERFCPGSVQKQNRVLSVGRLEERKGHAFLLEVLQRIPADRRPRLTIVYDDRASVHIEQALKALARERGMDVDWVYRPEQSDLVALYRSSRLALCAGVREPFGLVPLEAMACGTPVAAMREGGYAETIVDGETGFLLPRDAALWASTLQSALADPSRLERMGEAGIRHVQKSWTWDALAPQWLASFSRDGAGDPCYDRT